MEHEKWVWSDQHFFHDNIWARFKDAKGDPARPFKSNSEMHETMLRKHNELVGENDYVYWLGDVTFKIGSAFNELMSQFKGKKRLIVGNHDGRFLKEVGFTKWFEKIELWKGFADKDDWHANIHNPGFTFTHMPCRLDGLRDGAFNVHGHTHSNILEDKHYINVCVEPLDYMPMHFDGLFEIIRERQKDFNNRAKIDRKINT